MPCKFLKQRGDASHPIPPQKGVAAERPGRRKGAWVLTLGSILLLAVVLLLPLVNLQSYRFTLYDLPHKISRLVHGGVSQTVGYLLVAALVLAPLALLLVACIKKRVPKWLANLPLLVAGVLTILLLLASKPDPGLGLWIYLVVSWIMAIFSYERRYGGMEVRE